MSTGLTSDIRSAERRRRVPSLRVAMVMALLVLVPTAALSKGKQPKKTNGPYTISIGGSCTGKGTALIAAKQITINAEVEDELGNKGLIVAPAMILSGDHFTGIGLVMGQKATFAGRIDGYAQDTQFRGARVLCSYTDSNGKSGRVAGVLQR